MAAQRELTVVKTSGGRSGGSRKKAVVITAFRILNLWFLYGAPDKKNILQMFEASCLEQKKEIIVALRHQDKEEKKLAEELAEKISSFCKKDDGHQLKRMATA